jgi:hypothetical protein
MTRTRFLLPAVLLFSVAGAPQIAEAKKASTEKGASAAPEIQDTGIAAFDDVFGKVRAIHDTLSGVETKLNAATDEVATSLGLPEGTPLRMSMWELKQRSGGKVNVAMAGGKPSLSLGGTSTDDVKKTVDASNRAVGTVGPALAELGKLPKQVMELVEACKALPGQLNPQLLTEAGLTPMQLPKIAGQLGKNLKATVATPKRIDTLVKTAKGVLTGIPEGLAATEAPTDEYMADKKASKKADKGKGGKAPKGGTAEELPRTETADLINQAVAAFDDAEIDSALDLLGQASASLTTTREPVSTVELEALYQTAALVHLVRGDASGATTNVTQALIVDPKAAPIKDLGPDYAKLHKSLAKVNLTRTVDVHVTGSGTARISGVEVAGGSTAKIAEGQHLVQVKHGDGWRSELVYVRAGYTLAL